MAETVAVLGAGGIMGLPVARNIARAGIEVRAWNRTREKAEPLADDGVRIASSPSEAAADADAVITLLADEDAVLEAMDEALEAMGDGSVWVQMSTVGIETTQRFAELAGEQGVTFVDAPVLGTKAPAEKGELLVLASGPEEVRHRLEPVLDAIGRRTIWAGEAGSGTRMKLVTNAWVLSVMEGAAEAMALAEGIGVDPALLLDAVSGGPLDIPYLQIKGKMILDREFPPSFRLRLAAKDARLVEEAAGRHGLDLPLLEAIRRRMEEGAAEHGDEDMAATYLTSAA